MHKTSKMGVQILKALASENRLNIIRLIDKNEKNKIETPVKEMAKIIGITQPSISLHLAILRRAGIVRYRVKRVKKHPEYIYSLTSSIIPLLDQLENVVEKQKNDMGKEELHPKDNFSPSPPSDSPFRDQQRD